MGRDANFSELREAIRQGQAKIAQGLKTGQMRSDRDKGNRVPVPRLDPAREMLAKKPMLTEKSAIFAHVEKKKFRFRLPALPKIRIRLPRIPLPGIRPILYGIAAVLGVALAVLVVFWVGKALIGLATYSSQNPPAESAQTVPVESMGERNAPSGVTQSVPPPQPEPRRETTPPPAEPVRQAAPDALVRTGNNAIVIQYITSSRENELRPVQAFFAKNGVATEIIRSGTGSYLITQGRFENPNRSGSDGYQILLKIRAIGKRYPVETGDRQFGAEPFQDAYGKLMQ